MRKFTRTACLAIAIAGLAASSAHGTIGPAMFGSASPFGTGSNIAQVAQSEGGDRSGPDWGFAGGGGSVPCSRVVYRVTSVTTTTASVDPSFSGCTLVVGSPLALVTITTPCAWTVHFTNAQFSNATGAGSGGTLSTNCTTTFVLPQIGCTVDMAPHTSEGVSWQNVTTTGANSTSATPWGMALSTNLTNMTYEGTGGCFGFGTHGDFALASTVSFKNLWGTL
jgi:hypothetical protein